MQPKQVKGNDCPCERSRVEKDAVDEAVVKDGLEKRLICF